MLTLLGVAITVAAWFISRDHRVSVFWLVMLAIAAFILLATFIVASVDAFHASSHVLPRVRLARPAPSTYHDVRAILLLDASALFSPDSVVSIYALEQQEYEVLVGFGRVVTVQDNGFIQIGVLELAGEAEDMLSRILNNERQALESLRVKPHVPRSEFVLSGGKL